MVKDVYDINRIKQDMDLVLSRISIIHLCPVRYKSCFKDDKRFMIRDNKLVGNDEELIGKHVTTLSEMVNG